MELKEVDNGVKGSGQSAQYQIQCIVSCSFV
jgi:hypothetical protein